MKKNILYALIGFLLWANVVNARYHKMRSGKAHHAHASLATEIDVAPISTQPMQQSVPPQPMGSYIVHTAPVEPPIVSTQAQPVIFAPTQPPVAVQEEPTAVAQSEPIIHEEESQEPENDEAQQELEIEMQTHVAPRDQEEPEIPTVQSPVIERFNLDAKKEAAIKLVEKGISYIMSNPDDKAFSALSHDKRFVDGELYLFAFDSSKKSAGICLAHGQQKDLIWQNLINLKDTYGTFIVQSLIEKARQGGGWVTYQWRGATKESYVKEVRKGDKTFTIGAGLYPHSKVDAVVNMVKAAVALFNQAMAQGRSDDEAFSTFSYPLGRFVFGDLYLYALDFNGTQVAHGELPGIIGTNALNYKDANGKFVNQEIIKRLKEVDVGTGIWIDYFSRNAPKKAYAEKVIDRQGKSYFIACGYYPTADRNQAVSLVKKAYQYMKANGKSQAARAFNDKKSDQFRYGDLYLVVYTLKGDVVANGGNPSFVGINQYNDKDEDGLYYVREIIKKAEVGGGWVDFKLKNSFQSMYVEKIDLGVESLVIGCGLYPISKYETMTLLAKSGASYLKAHDTATTFNEFSKKDSQFIRGDLELFVFDTAGICFVYGDDYDLIWRNLFNINDDDGKPFVKILINTAKRGPGNVTFRLNGVMKTAYVEPVQKDGRVYIVGSSFYH